MRSFHDEQKRRQTEEQRELDEIKQEVFNLPDNIQERGSCTRHLLKRGR